MESSFLLWLFSLSSRALDGTADAAASGAVIGILMKLYPDRVASIMSWTETAFGFGYTIGEEIHIKSSL